MNVYLLRHAIAAEASVGRADSRRPLTAEGIQKMRRVAKGMRALELSFEVILSSPLLRARQTAEIVAKTFKAQDRLKLSNNLAPHGRHAALIREINQLDPPAENALLVGHEPHLSRLLSLLVTGAPDCSFTLKKAGLCLLSAETLRPGRCALEWLLTPKQLSLLRKGQGS